MSARKLWLLTLLAAGSCAQELSTLLPFPCAQDQTCPLGLACIPEVGCAAAQLDGLCGPETDCGLAGGSCRLGLCAPACAPGCVAGRVCARIGVEDACVLDCGAGTACAPGLECKELWYGGLRGCLPAARTPSACAATVPQPRPVCGDASFNLTCANGNVCAENSSCLSNGTSCRCNPGYASWSCVTDQPCSPASPCAYPNWYCLPEGLSSSCVKDMSFSPSLYQCADGRELRATCQTSCQSACQDGARCDPVRQTCSALGRPKCTLADTDAGTVITTCVPRAGALPIGAPCTRDETSREASDDCAAGGVCTTLGDPSTLRCRGFCAGNAGCDAGFHCVPITEPPRVGMCAPGCALFSSCGPGATCGPARDFDDQAVARCRALSPAAQGTPCTLQADCDAFQVCAVQADGGEGCSALCDTTHPCGAGACIAIGNSRLPAGSGFCR